MDILIFQVKKPVKKLFLLTAKYLNISPTALFIRCLSSVYIEEISKVLTEQQKLLNSNEKTLFEVLNDE